VLRRLDGDVQRAPLRALAPDLLDPAGTVRRLVAGDAGP
jgi:hypothetical protein